MPPALDRPHRRTSLNLWESDCLAMERLYGRGWTEQVRLMVEYHVKEKTKPIDVRELYNDE